MRRRPAAPCHSRARQDATRREDTDAKRCEAPHAPAGCRDGDEAGTGDVPCRQDTFWSGES